MPPRRPRIQSRLIWLPLLLTLSGLLSAGPARAADPEAVARIKLAYLYNFIKFTVWPDPAHAGFQLCIVGDHGLVHLAEQQLAGRKLHGQPVQVVVAEPEAVEGCQLLYLSAGVAPPVATAAMLTVGEGRGFLEQGGMIAFEILQDRVRFAIRLDQVRRARLRADTQLLTAALEVIQ